VAAWAGDAVTGQRPALERRVYQRRGITGLGARLDMPDHDDTPDQPAS